MLKGSFSAISTGGKLMLLILLTVSLLLLASIFSLALLIPVYGREIIQIVSSPDYANPSTVAALKTIQMVSMGLGMLLPAWFYLWLSTPSPSQYTGANRRISPAFFWLGVGLILAAQPAIGWTNSLNEQLVLPDGLWRLENWMKNSENQAKLLTGAFLNTTSFGGLIVNVLMIAILPALAEELLFRGALLGLLKEWSKSTHLAVIVSAIVFAGVHLQFYGFLPRFLLGLCLGYLYVWSGSIWVPVLIHFTNNLLSVIAEYLFRNKIISFDAESLGSSESWPLVAGSLVITFLLLFALQRMGRKSLPSGVIQP